MPEPIATILVVDDDEILRGVISQILKDEGFAVETAPSLFRAEGMLRRVCPQLVILDRQLQDGDGLRLCEKLRKDKSTESIPVLFLSASLKKVGDRVEGLNSGADDYLAKPFQAEELLARVKSLLRRAKALPAARSVLKAGSIVMDLDAHKVFVDGKEMPALAPKEYYLLSAFLASPGKVFSREALLQLVWGPGKELIRTPTVVDMTISNLKKKLAKAGAAIVTVRGEGFRFDADAVSTR